MDFVVGRAVEQHEDLRTEFKEITGANAADRIRAIAHHYAVGFLNREGGTIQWGIRDSDRVVVGVALTEAERDKLQQDIHSKLRGIQPATALVPDQFRLEFHRVAQEDGTCIPDLYVPELTTTAGSPAVVYATSSNKVFVMSSGVVSELKWPAILNFVKERQALADPSWVDAPLARAVARVEAEWPPDPAYATLVLVIEPVVPPAQLLRRALPEREEPVTLLAYTTRAGRLDPAPYAPKIAEHGWQPYGTGWRSWAELGGCRDSAVQLAFEHDGRAALWCPRAAITLSWYHAAPPLTLVESLVLGQTVQALSISGSLYRDAGLTREMIAVGVTVKGLAGRRLASFATRDRFIEPVAFPHDYRERLTVTAEELAAFPCELGGRLVGRLIDAATHRLR